MAFPPLLAPVQVDDTGAGLGQMGRGALAALPLVTVATDILATMATFGEAGVSDA